MPNLSFFASFWSLREYPGRGSREWSSRRKVQEIQAAGFDGVMSSWKDIPRDRGNLRLWGITSLGVRSDVEKAINDMAGQGAEALTVQLGDFDSSLHDMTKLVLRIDACAKRAGLPTAIEIHRDTFLETPERTVALQRAFAEKTGASLEICWDFSHFAVVRHLRAPFSALLEPEKDILRSSQFHLRPFNGHHCQIPASDGSGHKTPEYRDWLKWAGTLFALLGNSRVDDIRIVAELGNASPAYGLSCFPDVWEDAKRVFRDLKAMRKKAA